MSIHHLTTQKKNEKEKTQALQTMKAKAIAVLYLSSYDHLINYKSSTSKNAKTWKKNGNMNHCHNCPLIREVQNRHRISRLSFMINFEHKTDLGCRE